MFTLFIFCKPATFFQRNKRLPLFLLYICRKQATIKEMKALSLLMSIFVLLMSAMPCSAIFGHAHPDSTACVSEQSAGHTPASPCPDGHCCCSPFSCCGCAHFIASRQSVLSTDTQYPRPDAGISPLTIYMHRCYLKIWNPPR